MKYLTHRLLALILSLACPAASQAAVFMATYAVNTDVPDNDPSGIANVQSISTPIMFVNSVTVTFTLSSTFAMWNGDYYAYLQHDSGFAVLLNRAGRTMLNPDGYDDSGFDVTFDDTAAGDIHLYQNSVDPAGGVLIGAWQPDARLIDPALSLDTSPRSAFLSSFNGLDPNGTWTLFVADVAAGGEGELVSWGITINGQVPEPGRALLITAGLLAFICRRRRRN